MKTFSITIGGAERSLRYRSLDAIDLKKRFGKSLARLINEDILAVRGTTFTTDFDPEARIAFLYAGLRNADKKMTEAHVRDWVDEHMVTPGENVLHLVIVAANAAFYSGAVTGYSLDVGMRAQMDADGEEGKGQAPPEAAPST